FGCGTSMNLAEVFYRNMYKPNKYLGLDIRDLNIKGKKLIELDWCEFKKQNLISEINEKGFNWDLITSNEVIEHIGKQNADKFLQNILNNCSEKTKVLISTPNYDENVGAAGNHTYDSGDGRGIVPQEFTYNELKLLFEKYFIIEEVYGTFASQKDYKHLMNDWQRQMFDNLYKYYDSNLLSNLMAPMFPEQSRNCIWILRKKLNEEGKLK
ncbi:MAG: methyltransferase domain-containing protein, partial [Patescibacteria group bacterium]